MRPCEALLFEEEIPAAAAAAVGAVRRADWKYYSEGKTRPIHRLLLMVLSAMSESARGFSMYVWVCV